MKKLIALLLALAMVLALAACGSSGSSTGAGTSAESSDKPAQIEKIRVYVPTSGKYDDIDAVMEKVNEIAR